MLKICEEFNTDYERMLNRNYSAIGESSENMIRRKVEALAKTLRQVRLSSPMRILDMGCGVGLFERHLSKDQQFDQIFALDLDFESLVCAKKRQISKAHFLMAEGNQMPFQDDTFDLSLTASTFHHITPERRPAFIREMIRVTKPNGLIAIFEHNPWNPATRLFVRICPLDKGVKLISASRFKKLLSAAGLEILAMNYIIFFPSPLAGLCSWEYRLRFLPLGVQYLILCRKPR